MRPFLIATLVLMAQQSSAQDTKSDAPKQPLRAPTQGPAAVKLLNQDELQKATAAAKAAFEQASDPKGKPEDKPKEWRKVLELVAPVMVTLDKMSKDDPNFDKKRLKEPLWWQTKALKELKQDAQPGFDRYLSLFAKELPPRDLAIVLREEYFFLVEVVPDDATLLRQRYRDAVLVAEASLKAIDKSEEDDPWKVVIAVDLAMAHQRLVMGEKGVNYYSLAEDALDEAKEKHKAAKTALDKAGDNDRQDAQKNLEAAGKKLAEADKEFKAVNEHAVQADAWFGKALDRMSKCKTMEFRQRTALSLGIPLLRSQLRQSIGHDPAGPVQDK